MSKTIVDQRLPGATVLRNGLEITEGLGFDDYLALGQTLGRMMGGVAWLIGDWAHYGEALYGRKYEEALAVTGLSYGTLRNYAYVAGRFDVSRRRDGLSFAHHAEVAPLSPREQDHWLQLAENEGLTREQLRETMSGRTKAVGNGNHERLPALSLKPLSPEEVAAWNKAAESQGLSLGDWARKVLDEAASASG